MNKYLIRILLVAVVILTVVMSGCQMAKNAGRDVVEGAIEAVESKVIELHGDYARQHIANAMKEGFAEIDVDPNLDGVIDWEEYKAFQVKAQVHILKEITKDVADGKSLAEIKAHAITMEEALGVSGGISALASVLLSMYRSRTRKKDMKALKEGKA